LTGLLHDTLEKQMETWCSWSTCNGRTRSWVL